MNTTTTTWLRGLLITGLSLQALACNGESASAEGVPEACDEGQIAEFREGKWTCSLKNTLPQINTLADADLDCADGEVAVFLQGIWRCGAPESASGGDITAVVTEPNSGLSGGDESGSVSLQVKFGGSGTANSVSRADHVHDFLDLANVPDELADGTDDDALASLSCTDAQVPVFNASDSAWECGTVSGSGGVELDPSVNSLGKSLALSACALGQSPVATMTGWQCADLSMSGETLASLSGCSDGQVPTYYSASGWDCADPSGPGGGGSGDITAVTAGDGLSGGADSGAATLSVDFGSVCASGQVACAEHTHPTVTPALGDVLTAGADAGGNRLSNVGTPVASSDVATKGYVDALGGGGGGSLATAICCGPDCVSAMEDWVCHDVANTGRIAVPLPDSKGTLLVPGSGMAQLITPASVATDLSDCASEWSVCTRSGISGLEVSCGLFNSSANPGPWECVAPPLAYFILPGMGGMYFVDGGSDMNEILGDDGASLAVPDGAMGTQPAYIDCSTADEVQPGSGIRTLVCVR